MKGSSHAQIGFASAVAVTALLPFTTTVLTVTAIPAIGIITGVAGGLFPDIDHEHSEYGRKLKRIRRLLTALGRVSTVIGLALLAIHFFGLIKSPIIAPFYVFPISIGLVLMALGFMAGLLKHRGIAHTLLFPAVMTGIYYIIGFKYSLGVVSLLICSMIIGFNIGYVSHILADSLNGKGVPLLWPLSPSKISFFDIPYGGTGERTAVILLYVIALCCVVHRCIGYL